MAWNWDAIAAIAGMLAAISVALTVVYLALQIKASTRATHSQTYHLATSALAEGQTHHIAFRTRDREEQEAWRDHLLSRGIQVTPVQDRQYFESIYFRAPDGLLVELATDGPGFAVDEDPEELGRVLKLPSWLEPRRSQIEAALTPLPEAVEVVS